MPERGGAGGNGPRPGETPGREGAGGAGAPPDETLGGYVRIHDRPPAFRGTDGHPYTVSVEVERTGDLRAPYAAYLVFPRWARTGIGIVGHVESRTVARGRSETEVRERAEALTLHEAKALLEEAIRRRGEGGRPVPPGPTTAET